MTPRASSDRNSPVILSLQKTRVDFALSTTQAIIPSLAWPGPAFPGKHRAGPVAVSERRPPAPPPPHSAAALPGQRGRGAGQVLVTERKQTMPLPETIFCAQQIKIPPELPDILKQFTKAAIRTQPYDVLQWAAAYFSALSKGEPLPVKERLEIPLATEKTEAALTLGLLKVLHKQLSPKGVVNVAELKEKWKHLCLPEEQLEAILQLDNFGEEVEWMKVLALGCSVLGESLLSSMKHACEILTEDPDGGAARVPFETFSFLYSYLASIDGEIPEEETEAFLCGIKELADQQSGMVLLRNFLTQP